MAEAKRLNYLKGALFALGGPIAGIILWVGLWWFGFIASVTAFVMAWLTVWLFRKGAGDVDRKSLDIIIPYIIVGLLLAFFTSFSLDSAYYAQQEVEGLKGLSIGHILTTAQFWSFNLNSFLSPYDLAPYTLDIIISVGFSILGVYPTIKPLTIKAKADEANAQSKIKDAPKPDTSVESQTPAPLQSEKKPKKAWLAVLLNIIPGAGYLYLNPKRVFGWMLIIAHAITASAVIATMNEPAPEVTNAGADIALSIGYTLLYASFMVDAFFETRRVNKSA